jgi:hypothetical protein
VRTWCSGVIFTRPTGTRAGLVWRVVRSRARTTPPGLPRGYCCHTPGKAVGIRSVESRSGHAGIKRKPDAKCRLTAFGTQPE